MNYLRVSINKSDEHTVHLCPISALAPSSYRRFLTNKTDFILMYKTSIQLNVPFQ